MALNVLLLSNMGPSSEKPNSGRFVHNQFIALNELDNLNVEFFYLNQDEKTGLAKLLRYPQFFIRFLIRYVLSAKRLDIIHVHFYFPTILLAACYKLFRNPKTKIVVTFHGSDIYYYSPPKFLYRLCSHLVNRFVFVSKSLHLKFFRDVQADIISAGVLDVFYQPRLEAQEKTYDLIFVGHLDFNKGIDRLTGILSSCGTGLNVAVVGTGALQPQITDNGCKITYLGPKSPQELFVLYQKSKFLINLSRNESFGLVMTEAMACGTPVIATRTDGAAAQIINKKNGFILENCDDWLKSNGGECLNSILSLGEESYNALTEHAAESAQPYKLSNITERLDAIYSELTLSVQKIND